MSESRLSVQFVLMPYASLARPSIGLGLLKAQLENAGIPAGVRYSNLRFASDVGWDVFGMLLRGEPSHFLGDWSFGEAAFPEFEAKPPWIDEKPSAGSFYDVAPSQFEEAMRLLRRYAGWFVHNEAERILARGPRIVGCSSTFEQHVPSLALLRAIKRLDPTVVTVIGGANCEMQMGWATLREFPWVDFVASGEADESIVPFCESILAHGRDVTAEKLPDGILGRVHLAAESATPPKLPRGTVQDLNVLPVPDYTEFFAEVAACPAGVNIRPGLLAETSRGCWWGAVSHCTFCGLNGDGMAYRSKSPDRVLQEFHSLAADWKIDALEVVDNIIDNKYLKTLLPELEAQGRPFVLFYETKANLRREQVAQMARAGIRFIQPGIESLHDSLLSLMAKGCSAMGNVQLLKYAREFGINVAWTFLVGFPMEEDEWHREVASFVPLLEHLPPPATSFEVRFDRFSPYHSDQEKYGLSLVPFRSYHSIYPLDETQMQDLAYFFTDKNRTGSVFDHPGGRLLSRATEKWNHDFHNRKFPSILSMSELDGGIEFFDTRQCALERRSRIAGLLAEIYRLCDPARLESSLTDLINGERKKAGVSERVDEAEVNQAIKDLDERRLVLRVHGKILALALRGEVPALRPISDAGGSYINPPGVGDRRMILKRALDHLKEIVDRPEKTYSAQV